MLFKKVSEYVLTGLQKATRVVCDSQSTRDDLVSRDLVPAERVDVVPLGVDPVCSPREDRAADDEATQRLGHVGHAVEVLHVGSTIARKRVDILLHVFAELRKSHPNARLVRVGGAFTREQMALQQRLGLDRSVSVLPPLSRRVVAAIYRRASVALLPSEREGFGFPVIEAMACGTPVLASDLPVLREVGGPAASYCAVGDVERWAHMLRDLLQERQTQPDRWMARRKACILQAAQFSWDAHARSMVDIYRRALAS